MRKVNKAGLDLIKSFEGLELKAYQDSVGVWTIGYGHTEGVKRGDVITREEANRIFEEDINHFAAGVEKLIHRDVTDNQFAAMVSLAFNVGIGNFQRSTLLKLVNSGHPQAAAEQFLSWNRAGGQVLNGLTRRRKAERALFLDRPVQRSAADIQQGEDGESPEPISSPSPLAAESPSQQADAGSAAAQVNVGTNAPPPVVSTPTDTPVTVAAVVPVSGSKKSILATITAALAFIGLNIKEFFSTAYDAAKDNPMAVTFLVCATVLIIIVYWRYMDRRSKLDQQKQQHAHELTLEMLRLNADPTKYNVEMEKK